MSFAIAPKAIAPDCKAIAKAYIHNAIAPNLNEVSYISNAIAHHAIAVVSIDDAIPLQTV